MANRHFIEYTLNFLSIPEYIKKKGRLHGHSYGKTPEKKEYHLAHNLKKRCIKKNFKGIHDRFVRDPEFRTAMPEHERDEEVCIKWDDLADKDFSHYMTESEYFRCISLETLVYTKPFTPRIWRTTTQAHALLEVPATAIVIEFFLHPVAMEWILVVFLRVQRK